MPERKSGENPFEGLSLSEKRELGVWLENAGIEVLPTETYLEKIRIQRPGGPVDVTSSPKHGIQATKRFSLELLAEGVTPVPHLAARNIPDGQFEGIFEAFSESNLKRFLAVGGDNVKSLGRRTSTMDLLNDMAILGYIPKVIEVAGYPRTHSFIKSEDRDRALIEKYEFATKHRIEMKVKTQICAYPGNIAEFAEHLKKLGVNAPLIVGLFGPVQLVKANEHLMEVGVDEVQLIIERHKTGNILEDISLLRFDPKDYLRELTSCVDNGAVEGIYFIPMGNYNKTLEMISEVKGLISEPS